MIEEIKKETNNRMSKSIDSLLQELKKLRTGRAHASLLDHIFVNYYGTTVPLCQVASISMIDARTLQVTPWEKGMASSIEKAILKSDLGLNPSTDGAVVRIPLPPLTEERRRDLIKIVRQEGETTRIAIRNIRRDCNQQLKLLLKDKKISEDSERQTQEEIQRLTSHYIQTVDKQITDKESELMEI